jgi:molybdopterin synthase sulfur carrier subunit
MRIRVVLPPHLRKLAQVGAELELEVEAPITQRSILDALEARYPMLRGTIREHGTQKRRPFLRFFACNQDFSLDPPETPLPTAVASAEEPFLIVGAIAGG